MTADGIAPDQAVIDAIAASGIISSVTVGVLPGAAVPPPLDRLPPLMLAHLKNMYDSGVRITVGPDGGVAPAKPMMSFRTPFPLWSRQASPHAQPSPPLPPPRPRRVD